MQRVALLHGAWLRCKRTKQTTRCFDMQLQSQRSYRPPNDSSKLAHLALGRASVLVPLRLSNEQILIVRVPPGDCLPYFLLPHRC
jgi:hypothetical protein